jgi:hypothetical protein
VSLDKGREVIELIEAFHASYRETDDPHYAWLAFTWARDASEPVPEWVLEYFDRTADALLELEEYVRADLAHARLARKNTPKRETYYYKLAAAVGWGKAWPRLRHEAKQFIAAWVGARRGRGYSKKRAVADASHAFNVSSDIVKSALKKTRQVVFHSPRHFP